MTHEELIERIRSRICRNPNLELVIVFGSYASQKETASSDLDVAVAASLPLSAEVKLEISEGLAEEFACEVDVVDLQTAHGAILQEILTRGKIVLNLNLESYEKLVKRMFAEKEDDSRVASRIVAERVKKWSRQTKH